MDKEFVRELIELVKNSNIKVLRVESEEGKVLIETHRGEGKPPDVKHQEVLPPSEEKKEEKNLHVIKSPLVGTFYRAPSPGAPPFVEVGDIVSPGQVMCIIEALKVMNEIESDVRGRVEKILVENGETVEYGQPLFLIDTDI